MNLSAMLVYTKYHAYCELKAQACQAVLAATLHYTFLLSSQGEMAHQMEEEVGSAVSLSVPASPAASVASRKGTGKIQFLYGSVY